MRDHEKKLEYVEANTVNLKDQLEAHVEESTNNLKDQHKMLEAHVEKSTNNLKAHVANSD